MGHNLLDNLLGDAHKRTKYVLVALLLSAGFVIWLVAWPDPIPPQINQVAVSGHKYLKTDEIIQIMGIGPNSAREGLDLGDMRKKLIDHPRIQDAILTQEKNRIQVTIQEVETEFLAETPAHIYEVDSTGKILSTDSVRDPHHAILSGDFITDGSSLKDPVFLSLRDFIRRGYKSYPQLEKRISEWKISNDGSVECFVDSPHSIRVQIGNDASQKQFRKLYASLAYFEAEEQNPDLLDLRGEDAVYH